MLYDWSQKWLLDFNKDKCKVLHVDKKNPRYDYIMDGKTLSSTAEETDLGIIMTEELNFSKHIGQAAAKANRVLGMIKRCFDYISKESLIFLFCIKHM